MNYFLKGLAAPGTRDTVGRKIERAYTEGLAPGTRDTAGRKIIRAYNTIRDLKDIRAAEEAEKLRKEEEARVLGLRRKNRRASILTSPQGIPDPLG